MSSWFRCLSLSALGLLEVPLVPNFSDGNLQLRQINAGLAFMAAVVAHPQKTFVPGETGIAGVATGGEFRKLDQFVELDIFC